ncbi:MAG: hypothetical protein KDK45_23795, partial [Leptospiraceae bacterium]|nr:hypothetical protein [Leptospiraceae bacterium]
KFGFIRYKGPIIRINLYDDFIVISGRSVVKIDYKDLSFKRSSYYFFNKALLVMEKSKEHPAEIYLIPPDNKEFYEILLKKGVKILE